MPRRVPKKRGKAATSAAAPASPKSSPSPKAASSPKATSSPKAQMTPTKATAADHTAVREAATESKEAAVAFAQSVFARADNNGDGTLSKTEVRKFFKNNPHDKVRLAKMRKMGAAVWPWTSQRSADSRTLAAVWNCPASG